MKSATILKWVCLAALTSYATWATIWAHDEASRHICRSIRVDVEARPPVDSIVRQGVIEELNRFPGKIKGIPIDQLDTRRISRYLNNLNTFETVNCMVTAGGELCVSVTPMVPVMRVFFGNNSYYINKNGKHIASNAEFFSDVPVVSGNFNHRFQPVHLLPLIRFIQNDKTMSELTSMVVARDANNIIVVPKITGHVVNFGDTTRLAEKRDALKLFYRKVMPYKGWQEYDTISVKFRGQVVATRRDKTRLNVAEEPVDEIDMEEATLPQADNISTNDTAPTKPKQDSPTESPTNTNPAKTQP